MQIDIRRSRDFWAGLMLIGIGAGSMFVARDYAFGTSLRMGPGYFPSVLGGVLILFGLVLLVRGWRIRERLEPGWSPRALIILPFAFVLFGALIERTGFVPALSALIVVAAAASRKVEPSRGRHPCCVPHGDVGRGLRLGIGAALPALSGLLNAMELFDNLVFGFGVAVSLQNLLYCFIGVLVGTLIGVLPGIGPLATIAMLLPITFNVPPVAALIMLAGIYYGAQYGGSTTAILVIFPARPARSSLASTATRWRGRDAPDRPSPSRRSARSSPARSARC